SRRGRRSRPRPASACGARRRPSARRSSSSTPPSAPCSATSASAKRRATAGAPTSASASATASPATAGAARPAPGRRAAAAAGGGGDGRRGGGTSAGLGAHTLAVEARFDASESDDATTLTEQLLGDAATVLERQRTQEGDDRREASLQVDYARPLLGLRVEAG